MKGFPRCWVLCFLLVAAALPLRAFAQVPAAADTSPLPPAVEVVPSIGHALGLAGVATSPDGRLIASAGFEDIKIWDAATGRLIRTFADGTQVNSIIAFLPDGRRVVTASEDFKIRIWQIETGKLLREFSGLTESINALAVSPDGHRILSAGSDKTVRVWDADTGTVVRVFDAHQKFLGPNSLATDGKSVVSADADGVVLVWNLDTGQIERTLASPEHHPKAVALSPDGHLILVDSSMGATVFDRQTGRLLRTLKTPKKTPVRWIGISPDSKIAVVADFDYGLGIWDIGSGVQKFAIEGLELKNDLDPIMFTVESVSNMFVAGAFVSGNQLVTVGRGLGTEGPSLKIWNLADGKLSNKIRGVGDARAHFSSIVAGAGDNEVFLSSGIAPRFKRQAVDKSAETLISRLDLSTGKLSDFISFPSYERTHSLSFRDGFLYSAGFDALIRINEKTKASDEITSLKVEHADDPSSDLCCNVRTALIPHSSLIAVVVDKDKIEIRDPATSGPPVRTLSGLDGVSNSMAVSADGQFLYVGSKSGQISVWNLQDGQKVFGWKAAGEEIANMATSTNGLLAFSSRFQTGVFDRSARLLFVVKGHQRPITDIAFSSDGQHLMSAGVDRIVNVWNTKTGQLEHVLSGHSAWLSAVNSSADGRYIISAAEDKSVRVWETATGKLLTTTYVFPDQQWVTITPEGFFDLSSPSAAAMLTVVKGIEVYSIDQFRDALYRPDLVKAKLALDVSGAVKAGSEKTNMTTVVDSGNPPKVTITSPIDGASVSSGEINVEASVAGQNGGIGRIEWRLNGRTLGVDTRGLGRVENSPGISGSDANVIKVSQKMALDPGDNSIEVLAFNAKNLLASPVAKIIVKATETVTAAKPRLFVLAVGVNDYFDGRLKLNFAVPDARSIAAAFDKVGRGFYESVQTTTMLDADVTRANLDSSFAKLATEIKPSDVFIFFVAGHGRTLNGHYYFLPQDFRYRDQSSYAENGLSQEQWQKWIAQIPAKKSILVYDTCESGTVSADNAVVASRGTQVIEEQAVAYQKLQYATGRTILAASTDTQPALEGYHGHGLFSYVLMRALEQAPTNNAGLIEVTSLISYVDDKVPEVSYQAFKYRQIPQSKLTGSNFAIGKPTAVMPDSNTPSVVNAGQIASGKSTHVVIAPADVFDKAGGNGVKTEQLPSGTVLSIIRTESGWSLVAKEGSAIGYVADDRLVRMQ